MPKHKFLSRKVFRDEPKEFLFPAICVLLSRNIREKAPELLGSAYISCLVPGLIEEYVSVAHFICSVLFSMCQKMRNSRVWDNPALPAPDLRGKTI